MTNTTSSTAELLIIMIFIIGLTVLAVYMEFNKKNSNTIRTIHIPNSKNRTTCEPSPSSNIKQQGIGAVQSIFARFRKATEDYLIRKGADI